MANETIEQANVEAERLKAEGNAAFKERRWQHAEELYSKAIERNPANHVYWSNRAGTHRTFIAHSSLGRLSVDWYSRPALLTTARPRLQPPTSTWRSLGAP